MIIYCPMCREAILKTTAEFKAGSSYTPEMFKAYKNFGRWENKLNLWCPRCRQFFIRDGVLLTEHGLIRVGQTDIDESVSIVYVGGDLDGMLKNSNIWNMPEQTKPFKCPDRGKGFIYKKAKSQPTAHKKII